TKGCPFGFRFFFIFVNKVSSTTAEAKPQPLHSESQNHEPRRKFHRFSKQLFVAHGFATRNE
ncbi:MAG: hypothetical protein ORO03_08890, partial [Alphaproteobacteria bacterium]|nr:hypothetical protein [Alphaproteobacteria bacterium]